jgi:hypothetical protein
VYGVEGLVNESVYISFCVDGGNRDTSRPIIRGSNALDKGFIRSIPEQDTNCVLSLQFLDLIHDVNIRFTENQTYPNCKIYLKLPRPERYEVSEFFLVGYFEFANSNIFSHRKTISGESLNKAILAGKKVNIFNSLYIEKIGEPAVKTTILRTSLGDIKQLRSSSLIEL